MENAVWISDVPDRPWLDLQGWFSDNITCGILIHDRLGGEVAAARPVLVELLIEGLVDVALARLERAGIQARRPTTDEWHRATMRNDPAAQTRTLELKLGMSLPVHVDLPCGLGGGTGMKLWPATFVLAELLLRPAYRCLVAGRNVLELGAGAAALPSLAACVSGARRVVASDGVSGVVERLKMNLQANLVGLGHRVEPLQLDWNQKKTPEALRPRRFDVVLFSDAVYHQRGAFFLADAVQLYLRRKGGIAIGAAPIQRGGPWQDFLADMAWRDFQSERLSVPDDVFTAAEENLQLDGDTPCATEEVRDVRVWKWKIGSPASCDDSYN